MAAIYNELEPYAAQWLRNLIAAGHIAAGTVDDRSIRDVTPDDVRGPGQRHFFAGIGVWSHALRLAGWPDELSVWTGSCPCQPFSAAGKGGGFDDERHLWPVWFELIRECRPAVVFGEQVASSAGLEWLDLVRADMEGAGYAVGAADLAAAGAGAPHIRQRLYFVAYADGQRLDGWRTGQESCRTEQPPRLCDVGGMGHALRDTGRRHPRAAPGAQEARDRGRIVNGHDGDRPGAAGAIGGFWADAEWIACRDGKARPAQPGAFPLADGVANRVGRLRATGNAIVAPIAAEFIGSVIDVLAGAT